MPDYKKVDNKVEVPKGTGVDGYLKTIEGILKLSRVQEIVLRPGRIEYVRFLHPAAEEEDGFRVDLSTLLPYHVIRNNDIEEMIVGVNNAAVTVSQMFAKAGQDGYNPFAFACHPETAFWHWHAVTTKVMLNHDEAYGLPILHDQQIPVDAFLLLAAFSREAKLIDLRRSYKISIPRPEGIK